MVANYPWDGRLDLRMESQYHASPEDSTFRMLASAYASMHTRMSASVEVRRQESLPVREAQGVDAAWHPGIRVPVCLYLCHCHNYYRRCRLSPARSSVGPGASRTAPSGTPCTVACKTGCTSWATRTS